MPCTQHDTAKAILVRHADYVMTVKANMPLSSLDDARAARMFSFSSMMTMSIQERWWHSACEPSTKYFRLPLGLRWMEGTYSNSSLAIGRCRSKVR